MKNIIRLLKVFLICASYCRKIKITQRKNRPDAIQKITQFKKDWAKLSLNNLGVELTISGAPVSEEPMLFVGNHLSYLDIPVIMAAAPVSFVAKEEVGHWPIIGDGCRAVGTVFVKRESLDSRKQAILKVGNACIDNKQSMCLFPSGTTSLSEDVPWRRGAFEIAKSHRLKIQPFRITYSSLEIAAFIGADAFIPHLWRLLNASKMRAEIEFHDPIEINLPEEDCQFWQNWTREILQKN
ncbi:MAG: lysophospholipid acyltransferase family protein [Proteobacteria bacterium]|nr:lysophospholipid acyltransferase family protein [Pseudomonadota bacterium]